MNEWTTLHLLTSVLSDASSLNFLLHLEMSESLAIFSFSLAKTNPSALFFFITIILLPCFGYCSFNYFYAFIFLIYLFCSILFNLQTHRSTLNWKSFLYSVASLRYHVFLLFPLIHFLERISITNVSVFLIQSFFTFCNLVFVPTKFNTLNLNFLWHFNSVCQLCPCFPWNSS